MVKFGRRLVSERHEEWSEYYIDYKVGPRKKERVRKETLGDFAIVDTPRAPFRFTMQHI